MMLTHARAHPEKGSLHDQALSIRGVHHPDSLGGCPPMYESTHINQLAGIATRVDCNLSSPEITCFQ